MVGQTGAAHRRINFAIFVKDFLTWPLIRSDPENNPPKLAPPAFRYTSGGGIFVLSSLCSLYFFYAPSRYVCRGLAPLTAAW